MLKSELKNKSSQWSRRKIAEVLQLDLDDTNTSNSSASRQDYSEDTFNENSSGSLIEGEHQTNANTTDEGVKASLVAAAVPKIVENNKTPLLVEILRRLPKSTDVHSESSKSASDTMGEANNETYVKAERSTTNQLSESF